MVLERYIEKGGKRMRYGYTTGSCATAASKGAAIMLLTQELVDAVAIDTPKGWRLDLELFDCQVGPDWARCSVIKDAGDDPDVTDGVRVFARVSLRDEPGVDFRAGTGVGTVTKKGLSLAVGEPAINPVPREMMTETLSQVAQDLDYSGGFVVEVAIPQGIELARRTFNPKLGIEGGLSVVGTSGIVEPMSEESLKASMKLELSTLTANGCDRVIFVPGNYGKDFADSLGLDEACLVKTSNYVGFMLEEAEHQGVKEILFVGHLGKLVKVAGGLFHTHSAVCDGRMEILAANAAWLGADRECVDGIMKSRTTDEAVAVIQKAGIPDFFNHLARRAKLRCEAKVFGNIHIEILLFSKEYGFLGQSDGAEALKEALCIR